MGFGRWKIEKQINHSLVLIPTYGSSDAEKLHKMLVKKGGEVSISDNWFFVKDSEGPLKDGELDRAEEWAKQIRA